FYEHRKEGWSSNEIKKKVINESDIVGYCIDGDVYCAKDKDNVYGVFFGIIYKSLIDKDEAFLNLVKMLKDGISLTLTNGDEEFLKYFKNILLESVNNNE